VVAYREAIRLQPNFARFHMHLGSALERIGQFTEAAASFWRGHELGFQDPRWSEPAADRARRCEKLAALVPRLAAVLQGKEQPADAAEGIAFAQLCKQKQLYGAAVRLYRDAFAAEPKLADDVATKSRYAAACYAALAGCGHGKDAPPADSPERPRLRRLALEWLRADLAAQRARFEQEPGKQRAMLDQDLRHWQRDRDLAGLREVDALAQLPADERQACQSLWADVRDLLKRVGGRE
jgi:serine/threonine-protein kinase